MSFVIGASSTLILSEHVDHRRSIRRPTARCRNMKPPCPFTPQCHQAKGARGASCTFCQATIGSSRGAALARVFTTWLHDLMLGRGQLFGVPRCVRMLGLFDTDSSIGLTGPATSHGHHAWATARRPAIKVCGTRDAISRMAFDPEAGERSCLNASPSISRSPSRHCQARERQLIQATTTRSKRITTEHFQ